MLNFSHVSTNVDSVGTTASVAELHTIVAARLLLLSSSELQFIIKYALSQWPSIVTFPFRRGENKGEPNLFITEAEQNSYIHFSLHPEAAGSQRCRFPL